MHSLAGERWLKYWVLYGLTVVAERLLDSHLDRWVAGLGVMCGLTDSSTVHSSSTLHECRVCVDTWGRAWEAAVEAGTSGGRQRHFECT